eukprot:TRINITY_DN5708_c0_g1_i1.p1 TRINITY_DN5708_c0_g1~~TRINITY_DN5708_c0_g1_i1.p1  ORF type:complete len:254 (+),score=78.20 TRINITY_DN5708_c0_g1_i1:141-902(+)
MSAIEQYSSSDDDDMDNATMAHYNDSASNAESSESESEKEQIDVSELSFAERKKLEDEGGVKVEKKASGFKKRQTPKQPERERKSKNDHRPIEVSSKKRVSTLRNVVDNVRKKTLDPRFMAHAGKVNTHEIRQHYEFVDKMREDELAAVRKEFKKAKGANKARLERKMQALQNKVAQVHNDKRNLKVKQELFKKERISVEGGKKPYFFKKADIKKAQLMAKFDELKKSGKLNRHMEKRRKRTAAKDRNFINTD